MRKLISLVRRRSVAIGGLMLFVAGCGDGDSQEALQTLDLTQAGLAKVSARLQTADFAPFKASVILSALDLANISDINYVVTPRPGTFSKSVSVTYTASGLRKRNLITASSSDVIVPIIGLYENYFNTVLLVVSFTDGSLRKFNINIPTEHYSGANNLQNPERVVARRQGEASGIDFVMTKPTDGTPVTIIDSDGYIRWISQTPGTASVLFRDNGIDVGDKDAPYLYREELDGPTNKVAISDPSVVRFHHDLEMGPKGILAEFDVTNRQEDFLAEIRPDGSLIKTWDMVAIIGTYMGNSSDAYQDFVRPGPDWFHMNSAIYDRSDDSIIVSSRENFIIKFDYNTSEIKWILGDKTKYWHSFPSLRSKALELRAGDLAPIGQHSLSLTSNGQLMVFNNGFESQNMPAGSPTGQSRGYSVVTAYTINPAAATSSADTIFDDGKELYSSICSSAYFSKGGSLLITYSHLGSGDVARIKGIGTKGETAFDYSYPTGFGCTTSWNSVPVPFDSMRFD